MKVVILAGGFGTRLSEYTDSIPKPMVPIGNMPILWHIMNSYSRFGYTDFICALGYKSQVVKDFFLNYYSLNSDFTVDLSNGTFKTLNATNVDWQVSLINTGLNSMTGGRLKRLAPYLNDNTFMLTYGDGLTDINIDDLVTFHKSHGKMVTVTAVHPVARFGELIIDNSVVSSFKEKPQTDKGWINGGFFVMEPEFLSLIDGDSTVLERDPLEKAFQLGELAAFQHPGFWQCMDTKRDCEYLNKLYESGAAPWM